MIYADVIKQQPFAQGTGTADMDLAAIRRGDYKCSDLWYMRNSLFKAAGYCFKTPQAIRTFGNVGCAYDKQDEVPLSARQRSILGEIQAAEITKSCPR